MSKIAAFATAFLATLAVALAPLAVSDRLSHRSLIEAETGTSYEYNVLPGLQTIASSLLDIALNPIKLTLSCGWHADCTITGDGGGIDIARGAGSPVYLVFEAVNGAVELEAKTQYIGDDKCKKIAVEITRKDTSEIVTHLYYTHIIRDELMPRTIKISRLNGSYTIEKIATVAQGSLTADLEGRTLQYWAERGYRTRIMERVPYREVHGWNDSTHDNLDCNTTGAHLHQAGDNSRPTDLWRNKSDEAGFPPRGTGNGWCFWSDTWLFKIQSSREKPSATDRSLYGPRESGCPLYTKYTLRTAVSGGGSGGSVSPPPSRTTQHRAGRRVSIVASPNPGYVAVWGNSGGFASSDGSEYTVTMDRDRTVTARFERDTAPAFPEGAKIADQMWARNTAITPFTLPDASGGNGTLRYSLSKDFPKDVVIAANHRVSGIPAIVMDRTVYTWTVTDADGDTDSLTFPLTIVAAPLAFPAGTTIGDQSWTQNSAIASFTLPGAEGGNGTLSYSLNKDFPDSVDVGDNRRVSGTPKSAMEREQYTWTVTDGDGGTASITFSVTVAAASAEPSPEPTPEQCTLTVVAKPEVGGTVSGGRTVNCNSSTKLTAKAKPKPGYRFSHWSGDGTGTGASKRTVAMSTDRSVTAHFAVTPEPTPEQCTLTVDASPPEGGTVSDDTTVDCSTSTNLKAKAEPNTGYRFSHWSGDGTGTGASERTVTMSSDRSVTAHFVREEPPPVTQYTLTVMASPASCSQNVTGDGTTHDSGDTASFSVSWKANCGFVGWSSGVTDIDTSTADRTRSGEIVMSSDRTVTATLSKIQYALTVEATPASCGTTGGTDTYDAGTEATVSVEWNAGCSFTGWSSGVSGIKTNHRTRTSSGKVTVNRVMPSPPPCRRTSTR